MVSDTSRKEQVLQWICENPFISQQELAQRCGLSRSAVAGHIASLIREGRLLGRAYLLPQNSGQIVCIGGSNLDRKMRLCGPLCMGASNPVTQSESAGGVARNIAENLARLGCATALLSAFGDDPAGQALRAQLQSLGVELEASLVLPGASSDSYCAVLDASGEMQLALAHMHLVEQISAAWLQEKLARYQRSAMLCADMNVPPASLEYLLQLGRQGATLCLVAVSAPKMARLPQDLHGLDLLILNQGELAAAPGCDAAAAPQQNWAKLQARGLRRLILTRGAQGLSFAEGQTWQEVAAPPVAQVVDVTGAGDALAAAVCASLLRAPQDLAQACRIGMQAAQMTIQCASTVCPDLGAQLLQPASHSDASI
ncbi:carbohydrate kinase [Massilia sp. W12]|uniref:carbohydrate kinase n=1 Tax=Massilia sp. W12 TaxID=3126507 RepID=UPI0030CA840C